MLRFFLLFFLVLASSDPQAFSASQYNLRVVSEHFPPLQIWQKEQNTLRGMAVDVMNELLFLTKYKTTIEILPWARAYELARTQPNTLIFTIIRTEEREQYFKWVGSITPVGFNYIWTLKTRGDIKITSWQDANQYHAVAQRNGAQSIRLKNHGFLENKNLYLTTYYGQGIQMVLNGRADFFLGSDFLAGLFMKHLNINKDQFRKLMPHDYEDSLNIAFSKQTPDDLVNEFRRALKLMRQNGTLEKIVEKWAK